jgi:phosphotransferase system enzyme I (PtsP)
MLEVPSLLYQLDELLERVDFLSVGSNDLMQFSMPPTAAMHVAERFGPALGADPVGTAGDRGEGREHAKPVTLCGELASEPIGALALTAIGYRSFSLAHCGRSGKGDAARAPCRQGRNPDRALIDSPAGSVPIRERLKAFAAEQGLQP